VVSAQVGKAGKFHTFQHRIQICGIRTDFIIQRLTNALLIYKIARLLITATEIYQNRLLDNNCNKEKKHIIQRLRTERIPMREV
jgi:hypothetical protein